MLALSSLVSLAWLALAFLGLPLGVPPEKEEPLMTYAAPEECVFYATWTAMATPSAASGNQTEQLLAEPEVKKFFTVVERAVMNAALAAAKKNGVPAEQAEPIAKTAQLWIRTVFLKSGAMYVARMEPRGEDMDVQGAAIIQAGDVAVQLEQSFTALCSQGKEKPVETTVAGRPFRKLVIPDEKLEIVWGANNGYMMIGIGAGALEELSARIRERKEASWLTQLKANLPVERRSTITYLNIKKVVDTFGPTGGPEAERAINALSLKSLNSFQAVTGLDDSGMISRTLLAIDGPAGGPWTLLDEKGLGAADLKHVPADALAAIAFVFDARKVFDKVLATMEQIQPMAVEQAKQQLQQVATILGMDVAQALGALGSKWSFYSRVGENGLPAMALTIDVRDKPRLVDLEQRLRSMLPASGDIPNVGRMTQSQIGGQAATTIRFQAPQLAQYSPTWCITDKLLIVASSPQAVQAVMTSQGKPLTEKPEVSARLNGASAPLFVSYFDTPRSFAAAYAQLQVLLPQLKSIAELQDIPVQMEVSDLPAQSIIERHLRPSVSVVRRTAKGLESESRRTMPGPSVGASTGVMVALLLPAVQAAREAARRAQSSNQIRQQLLGLHNYHDVMGSFPPAYTVDANGKALLSWRVAILPYIEQQELYKSFRQDEPWDSEHNKRLLESMPALFRSPNSTAKPGMTVYLGAGGKQGVLGSPKEGGAKGTAMADIKDGTSNTIAIVEASDALAVEWTKPVEWTPDASDPLKGLLGMRPNGFLAGFADGHISFIAKTVDPQMLRNLFTYGDGNAVELPAARGPAGRGAAPGGAAPIVPKGKVPPPRPGKAKAGF